MLGMQLRWPPPSGHSHGNQALKYQGAEGQHVYMRCDHALILRGRWWCCSMNGMAHDGIWASPVGERGVLRYPSGQSGCQDLMNTGWMCAQHWVTHYSKGSKDASQLTFLGIIPLEVPHFLTHCSPLSLVFEDGHPTCGLWFIKLHLCCARVWLHLVDGWWRWGVCGKNTYGDPCKPQAGHDSQSQSTSLPLLLFWNPVTCILSSQPTLLCDFLPTCPMPRPSSLHWFFFLTSGLADLGSCFFSLSWHQ